MPIRKQSEKSTSSRSENPANAVAETAHLQSMNPNAWIQLKRQFFRLFMDNLPNFLSFLRVPLALLFLKSHLLYRSFAIISAMLTDCLDGFIARRFQLSSKLGTTLDPLADKFFVLFALSVFISENQISFFEAAAFICRDFSVAFFGIYLALTGKLASYKFRAIYCGKVTTFLQFVVLLGLTFRLEIPSYLYSSFIILGLMALIELYFNRSEQLYTTVDNKL